MKREQIYRKAMLAILAILCFILPNASAQNMDKGLRLIDMDQYRNASNVFKELTKQTPPNADAWYYLGVCYSELGNIDSASIAFNAGLVIDPKNPANLAGQGMVQHLKKDDVQAKATFLAASKLNQKKYPNGLVSILKGYSFCKYPIDEFIDGIYKKAQASTPKNSNIYLNWGKIAYNAKDYSAASLAYVRASTYDEKNISAHYLLGQMYNSARNFQAALIELDLALEIDPSFVPAIREKGDAYYELRKFDEAAVWYAKYIQLTEETASSMTQYAKILYNAKQYEKAHEILIKLLKLEPNNAVMLRLLGYVSYELKKDTDGINAMTKFFQIRKDSTSNIIYTDYEYFAKLLKRANQDSLAIVYYQKSLAVDSTNKIEFIATIGDLYGRQKKYLESNLYLEKSQQFRSGISPQLQNTIGGNYFAAAKQLLPADSLQKRALLVKADSAYARVCQSAPDLYYGYYSRARIANMEDPDGSKGLAKPFYEKTLALAQATKPEDNKSVILECLVYLASQNGFAYMNAQDAKDKAKQAVTKPLFIESLNKILAVDPTNQWALDNIKLMTAVAKKPGVKK